MTVVSAEGTMEQNKAKRRRIACIDGPDPIDLHVGQKLRFARMLAGVNQSELGAAIGISSQAVQKYEQGRNRISASRLFAIAGFLRCPVSFFFDGVEEQMAEADSLLDKELNLIRALRRIVNIDARHSIQRLIKQIGTTQDREPQASVSDLQ
jgi:transcriptional regulator with XRE-family HTH domain